MRAMRAPWSGPRGSRWRAGCGLARTRAIPTAPTSAGWKWRCRRRRSPIPSTSRSAGWRRSSHGWGRIEYVKPHGALYNVAVKNAEVARAIGDGVARWKAAAPVFGLAASPMLGVWKGMGLAPIGEAFADRRYEPDGTLRNRKFPDALITDPAAAAAQAVRLAREGKAQTICVHGDTPGSVEILRACCEALKSATVV